MVSAFWVGVVIGSFIFEGVVVVKQKEERQGWVGEGRVRWDWLCSAGAT